MFKTETAGSCLFWKLNREHGPLSPPPAVTPLRKILANTALAKLCDVILKH